MSAVYPGEMSAIVFQGSEIALAMGRTLHRNQQLECAMSLFDAVGIELQLSRD